MGATRGGTVIHTYSDAKDALRNIRARFCIAPDGSGRRSGLGANLGLQRRQTLGEPRLAGAPQLRIQLPLDGVGMCVDVGHRLDRLLRFDRQFARCAGGAGAISCAAESNWSSSTQRWTRPTRSASTPSITSPNTTAAMVVCGPAMRRNIHV